MNRLILVILILVGVPTSLVSAYRWYLTNGTKLAVAEISAIDSYKNCMKTLITLNETNLNSARQLIDSIDASYPDAKSADSKLATMSTMAGGGTTSNDSGLSARLKECRDELSLELTRYQVDTKAP